MTRGESACGLAAGSMFSLENTPVGCYKKLARYSLGINARWNNVSNSW